MSIQKDGKDKDGFTVLIKSQPDEYYRVSVQTEKEKPVKKVSKNPFKKGSWKFSLLKKLKKHHSTSKVSSFHFTKLENIIIYRNSKPKAILSKKAFSEETLRKMSEKYPDCYILINCRESMYMKLSLKSYLSLMEIDKMVIEYTMKASDDCENETYEIYDNRIVIDNINDLCNWINYYRQLIDGVGEVQAMCCSFTYYKYKVKTLIKKTDGSYETYKGDFNEVLKKYHITPLL